MRQFHEKRENLKKTQVTNTSEEEKKVFVIYEPSPSSCTPNNWGAFCEALRFVDIVSPNHEEIRDMAANALEERRKVRSISTETVAPMEMSETLGGMGWNIDPNIADLHEAADAILFSAAAVGSQFRGAIVIRAGERGCLVATRLKRQHIPAYWSVVKSIDDGELHSDRIPIIDPTGCGNSFCGGLAAAMDQAKTDSIGDNIFEAALYGTISARYAYFFIQPKPLLMCDQFLFFWY